MGAYLREVQQGDSCKGMKNLAAKTLNGYMASAETWWHNVTGYHIPLYENHPGKKEPQLVKFIADIFEQRRAWSQPKQKREPFTYAMFEALAVHIEAQICPRWFLLPIRYFRGVRLVSTQPPHRLTRR